MTIFCSFERY